jgi:hypothetical protein
MAIAPDDLEPGRLANAINDLLIRYGYPPDRVSSWWNDWSYDALNGRTPTQAWNDHDYQRVWEMMRAAYAASDNAAKRLANDSEHAALIDKRIAELQKRYES